LGASFAILTISVMKHNLQAGFTMSELIIGIVLFAMTIPIVAGVISTLSQMNDRTADTVSVSSIVENKVESLRSKGFNGVPLGTVSFSTELPTSLPTPRSASYTVTSVNSALKSVAVTVSYGGKQVDYTTYLGELGVGQY